MPFVPIEPITGVFTQPMVVGNQLYFIAPGFSLEKVDLDNGDRKLLVSQAHSIKKFGDRLLISIAPPASTPTAFRIYDLVTEKVSDPMPALDVLTAWQADDCSILHRQYKERSIHRRNICDETDEYIMPGNLDYFSALVGDILIGSTPGPFRYAVLGHDIKEKRLAWEFDLKVNARYFNSFRKNQEDGYAVNVIVWAGRIFALCPSKLICIDAQNGTEIWDHDFISDYRVMMTLVEETDQLLLYGYKNFFFIDCQTGKVVHESVSFQDSVNESNATYPVVEGKYIYITFVFIHKLAVIESETFKIVEVIPLNHCQGGIPITSPPIIYKNKIFQYCSDNVMYVHENK